MASRGYIALQKGNRIRYTYVNHDADNIGKDLKRMTDDELEAAFSAMCVLDHIKYRSKRPQTGCGFVRFEPNRQFKVWISYAIADRLRNKDMWPVADCYNAPLIDHGITYAAGRERMAFMASRSLVGDQVYGSRPVLFESIGFKKSDCGSFEIDHAVKTQADAINHARPYMNCEWVWYYNLDTKQCLGWGDDKEISFFKNGVERSILVNRKKIYGFTLKKSEINEIYSKYVLQIDKKER